MARPSARACQIWATSQGRVVYASEGAEYVIGWTADELIGLDILAFVPEQYKHLHQSKFNETVRTGESPAAGQRRSLDALGRDGLVRPINLTLCAIDAIPRLFVAIIERRGL